MKKKVEDLTIKDITQICKEHPECGDDCPLFNEKIPLKFCEMADVNDKVKKMEVNV